MPRPRPDRLPAPVARSRGSTKQARPRPAEQAEHEADYRETEVDLPEPHRALPPWAQTPRRYPGVQEASHDDASYGALESPRETGVFASSRKRPHTRGLRTRSLFPNPG